MKLKFIVIIFIAFVLFPINVTSQISIDDGVVQGKIIASSDGLGLVGATVVELDSKNRVMSATITDFNGEFVLKIKNIENTLVFSFIGFKTITKSIGNENFFDIALIEDNQMIEDIAVVAKKRHDDGSFSIPKREVSTAVQTFSTKKLEGLQVTSIDDALQGRIAGLDIIANSGDPGSGTSMRIRGVTSINGNQEPLIVVNGIPYDVPEDPSFSFSNANEEDFANMLSINPEDIEEITVLKDAASTAIWGSQGANGVLVVKTKKGVRGPTKIQYSYRLTGIVQPKGMNVLNGNDYTMMLKQAYFNPYQNENAASLDELMYNPNFSEYEKYNNNTDWIEEVTQVGFKHDHFLSLSGGGERAQYRVSGGFFTQSGTVIGQRLDRISSRALFDYRVSDRIKFVSEISFTYTDNDRSWTNDDNDNNKLGVLGIAYKKMPNLSVYQQDASGNNTDVYYNILNNSGLPSSQRDLRNPVALANLAKNNAKNYRIIPTFRLQYDILDPQKNYLRYDMATTVDLNNDQVNTFLPGEVGNATWDNKEFNYSTWYDKENISVFIENKMTWQPKFSNINHSLMLQGTHQITTGSINSMGLATSNLPSGEIVDASANGYLSDMSSSHSSFRSNAMMLRAHYSYMSKYVFSFTFRRDGSTKFGKDNRYGNFPGVSAKWILSDEPFMQSTNRWLSFLAFRPSWGIGGRPPDDEYLHYSRYASYQSYMGQTAMRPSTLQLSDLKWEKTTSWNYGVDLGFFNDRLIFDLNYYTKRTEDLLFKDTKLPSSSGYTNVKWQNIGTMDNEGWEINLQTNNLIKVNDLRVDFNFNISNNKNTVVELRQDVLDSYNKDYNYTNGTYLTRLQEGNSFGSIYGFRYKGVYQYNDYVAGSQESAPVARDVNGHVITDANGSPLAMRFAYGQSDAINYKFQGGDAIYEDINHDGSIDQLDIVYLGNSNPKVNGGFGSTLVYKKFAVTAFFNFRYGNKIVNMARMNAENMYGADNQSVAVNWRWRKDGDVTEIPRALYQYGYNWLGSDRFVEDGSFVRFKHLTFSYNFAKEKLKKYKIDRFSLSLTLNNLYVWTKYTGVDPEVKYDDLGVSKDEAQTPRSRDATLSLSLTF